MTCRRSAALAVALSVVFTLLVVSNAKVAIIQTELDPRDAYVLLQEGQLHLWMGNNAEQALSNFERIIDDYPTSKYVPIARLRKMMALESMGRTEDALKCGTEMIADYPGQTIAAWAQAQIGHVYLGLGDTQSAERELLKVEKQYAQLPDKGPLDQSRRDLGRLYLDARKAAESAAGEQPPSETPGSGELSASSPRTADPEAAGSPASEPSRPKDTSTQPSASEPATDIPETKIEPPEPADPQAEAHKTACVISAYVGEGDFTMALALYEELRSAHPESTEYIAWAAFEIADKLVDRGPVRSEDEQQKLFELLRTPEMLTPHDAFHAIKATLAYSRYCTVYGVLSGGELHRRYDIAAEALEKIITLYPDSPLIAEVLVRLGYDYQSADKTSEALEVFSRVVSEYPDSDRWFVEALSSVASIYSYRADQQNAVVYFEKLIASTRDLVLTRQAMSKLERLYRELGKSGEADELLEEHVMLLEWSLTDPGIYFEPQLRSQWESELSGLKERLAQSADPGSDASYPDE